MNSRKALVGAFLLKDSKQSKKYILGQLMIICLISISTMVFGVELEQKQSGSATMASGDTDISVSLPSATDMSRSVLLYSYTVDDDNSGQVLVGGELTGTTTIEFHRDASGSTVEIEWQVLEFFSGITVYRGSGTVADGNTVSIGTNVAEGRSWPILNYENGGSTFGNDDAAAVELINSGGAPAGTFDELQFTLESGNVEAYWQVVECATGECDVQSVTSSLTNPATSNTGTIPSAINTANTLLFTSHSIGGNIEGDDLPGTALTNGTTITYERADGNDVDIPTIITYVVEFTDGSTSVQHGSITMSGGTATQASAITSVDESLSMVISPGALGSQGHGGITGSDNPGANWFTLDFASGTSVSATRANSTNSATITYQVAEFATTSSQTWYSYTTGNWNDPDSWTLDGSVAPLYDNPSSDVPGAGDNVVITNGRTITLDVDNISVASVEVIGNLALSTSTGNDFTEIKGDGIINMSGDGSGNDNFPAGTVTGSNGFSNVNNGGTLELTGSGINLDQTRTFNKIEVNLDNASDEAVLLTDYTINGDLTITSGILKVNDNSATTSLNIDLYGDMTIEAGGELATGTANARHEFNFYGDFTNNGTAGFSQRTSQDVNSEATNGIVDANFLATDKDQTVRCNGLTYFYRIEIYKGTDDTYTLFLESTDASYFNLTGYANFYTTGDISTPSDNPNALGLITGTVSIGENVSITPLNNTGNYSIGTNAALIVNGGTVTKTGGFALTPYGTLEVASGTLTITSGSGIATRDNGQFIASGGTTTIPQFRTSNAGSEGGYKQTGGVVNIGEFTGSDSPSNSYYTFSLTYNENIFIMTDGTLNVEGATTEGLIFINSDPGNINVSGGTVNVTSSDINTNLSKITSRAPFYNLTIDNAYNSTNSNVKIGVQGGTSDAESLSTQDLIVLNDLTIKTGTTRDDGTSEYGGYLDLCADDSDCANLEVGGDFTIEDSAVIDFFTNDADDAGSATLTFNGTGDATFYIGDITSIDASLTDYDDPDNDGSYVDYRLPIYNLVIDKNGGTVQLAAKDPGLEDGAGVLTSSNGKNLDSNDARLLYIRDGITIESNSTLNQIDPTGEEYGYIVRVYSSTINLDGNLMVYEQGVNPTNSFLEVREQDPDNNPGTDVGDVILINSTDGSTIGNLVVDLGNDELKLGNDLVVNRFVYRHGGVNLSTHNLKVDILDFNTENNGDNERLRNGNSENLFGDNTSGAEQYFFTEGNASDGGLSVKVPRTTNVGGADDEDNIGADPAYDNTGGDARNHEYQNNNLLWFPIGIKDKYTPAVCYIVTDGTYTGDEYITVRPVNSELQTTNLSGGDILPYYWNVEYEGFGSGEEPVVSWLFQYDQGDVVGTESNYVPGKVLDGGAYTRSTDGGVNAIRHSGNSGNSGSNESGNIMGNNPGNIIIFNGTTINDDIVSIGGEKVFSDGGGPNTSDDPVNGNWDSAFPDVGFTLENANYTAGAAARFTGSVEIYYSAQSVEFTTGSYDWSDPNSWSTEGHDSNTNSGTYPQSGDVAYIGFDEGGANGNEATHIITSDIDIDIAELNFTKFIDNTDNGKPVLEDDGSANILEPSETNAFGFGGILYLPTNYNASLGTVAGEGRIRLAVDCSPCSSDPSSSTILIADLDGDFGEFNDEDLSRFYFDADDGLSGTEAVLIPLSFPETYPNVTIRADDGGYISFQEDIYINKELRLRDGGGLLLHDGANGDIEVVGNLRFQEDNNKTERIEFPNSGSRTLTINGDIDLEDEDSDDADYISVRNSSPSSAIHTLQLGGSLNLGDDGDYIDLYNTGVNANQAILELIGTSDESFNKTSGDPSLELYQIKMNKGSDLTYSFTFNDAFTVADPDDTDEQTIEILNGVLVFNNASINIQATNATAGDFQIPNTENSDASSGSGGLEIQQGTVTIEGDDTGIILDGLLRVSGGTLDMATGTGNDNNFIEYSSSGNAQIEVSGGVMNIAGQVRRSTTSTTGVLQYNQSGGSVTIAERNGTAEPVRGVFEVLNDGSDFTHTGGDFTIVKSNNSTTVPSVLIDPETSDVSGSTITFANDDGNDNMGLKSGITLNNITLDGASVSSPTVKLYQLPLTLAGDLTVDADDSHNDIFDANGFDITLTTGNFVNNGSFVSNGTFTDPQTFTFSSTGAQAISGTGSSDFYNFTKSGSGGTLTTTVDFSIENELNINSGTFATGSQSVNVLGDIIHNGTHTSSTEAAGTLYGIILSGSERQNIERDLVGTSAFGVLAINNPEGVLIEDETYFTFEIENKLILEQGVLDISSNLFVINENAVIENASGNSGVDDFTVTNMIQTNSSFTDYGLQKKFNTGAQTDFVFPVGQQLYTPVIIDMTANLAGSNPSITVRPSNEAHPTINDHDNAGGNSPGTLDDRENVLQYHWIITSSGITSFTGDLSFEYDQSDVTVLDPGDATASLSFTEDNYAGARLLFNDTNWDKSFDETSVDVTNNVITFSENDFSVGNGLNGGDDNQITGDYTAGILLDDANNPLDIGAVPNTVPEYETVNATGTFDDHNDWTPLNGSPALNPGDVPTGAIITIKSGDEMQVSSSNARIYRTIIENGGTLSIDENASNTRLGIVEGTGDIKLTSSTPGESPNLPAGYYASFFATDCSGGGLEYAGSVDYEVLANIPIIRHVVLSGTGSRTLPNNNTIQICEDLDIENSVNVIIPDGNNTITILGDINKSDASTFDNGGGSSRIAMEGTSTQTIAGAFTGSSALNQLEIDNASGVTIVNSAATGISADADIDIEDDLLLTNGRLTTNANNTLTIESNATGGNVTGSYGDNTHVNGPLTRILSGASGTFDFPVGDQGRLGRIAVKNPDLSDTWTATYFNENPQDPPYSPDNDLSGVDPLISDNQLWELASAGSNSALVRLYWDDISGITSPSSDLKVVRWDGGTSQWVDEGNSEFSGNSSSGYLTSDAVAFSTQLFTIGAVDENNDPLPVELISFNGEATESGILLEWSTASELNNDYFAIERSVDGKTFETIGKVIGNGTTNIRMDYQFADRNPYTGYNYYRLKQFDYDGAFEYSNIIGVKWENNGQVDFQLFPNPTTTNNINLRLSGIDGEALTKIKIADINGKMYYAAESILQSGDVTLQPGLGLSPGIYLITIEQNDFSKVLKLVVQ